MKGAVTFREMLDEQKPQFRDRAGTLISGTSNPSLINQRQKHICGLFDGHSLGRAVVSVAALVIGID
jgi:hypothetical protein